MHQMSTAIFISRKQK